MNAVSKEQVEIELKALIVETLELEDITPEEIDSEANLFGDPEGLELDSVDALEISVAIKKKYDVEINPKDENVREYLKNVSNLAAFVLDNLA